MIRKLFKTGNSVVVSLPREMLDELRLSDGDDISLSLDGEHHRLIISPIEEMLAQSGVDESISRLVSEFIEEYRPALEELAK